MKYKILNIGLLLLATVTSYNFLIHRSSFVGETGGNCFAQKKSYLPVSSAGSILHIGDIKLPRGFKRIKYKKGSFQEWLRHLKLKRPGSPVMLHDGSRKGNQGAHYAVINMAIGQKNLLQCADAIMKLRAEYFFQKKQYSSIAFNITSGQRMSFKKWASGYRPVIRKNRAFWRKKRARDYSRKSLLGYLDFIYSYAGTYSLSRELKPVRSAADIRTGDIFIKGGFPGHAVIVVDLAENRSTGDKIFLLAQSFMPAQEIHVLKNPKSAGLSPWYSTKIGNKLITPEWIFNPRSLKRFR